MHFRYEDSAAQYPDLIDGLDLTLEPGETMALVGLTGSGKSTVTALTTRLYDVTGGSITLDGVDMRDLTRYDLRKHIAMAFEDATLFSASVRDNVLLGRPEASEADLAEALEIAQSAFVYELPDGLDTKVGEEGLSLSGGQRQRLALARAVAAKPGGARARRPAVGTGCRHRGSRRGGAAAGARIHDGADRRAPAIHGHARRPGRAAAGRPDHGGRHGTPSCWHPTSTTASSSRASRTKRRAKPPSANGRRTTEPTRIERGWRSERHRC